MSNPWEVKEALQTLCIPYHTNLNYREVTHLIVRRVGTDKHRLALQKGLFCVSIDWVFACRDEGKLQEPGTFKVPVFSGLVTYYVEGGPSQRRNLTDTRLGGAERSYKVRGNLFSFLLPWEDVIRQLSDKCEEGDLSEWPWSPQA